MTTEPGGGFNSANPRATMSASRWQPAPVTCTAGASGTDAFAVIGGRLVAFDRIELQLTLQVADDALQQCSLAGTG
jgi:hypothetical protein